MLTKGLREFNQRPPLFADPPISRPQRLVTYVHSETNLSYYIAALLASNAFLEAAQTPYRNGRLLRHIVVPVLLTGHFQVFGWDRTWDQDSGQPVHDRLFVMTSMPHDVFPIDPHASDDILAEFRRQLGGACMPNTELTPYPGAGRVLRAIAKREEFFDLDCFYLSMLYTFFLAMVEDINSPDTAAWLTQSKVWCAFREGYMRYEERLLFMLEYYSTDHWPVLLGPSWGDAFLNIRDARVVTQYDGYAYRYTWDEGWLLTLS